MFSLLKEAIDSFWFSTKNFDDNSDADVSDLKIENSKNLNQLLNAKEKKKENLFHDSEWLIKQLPVGMIQEQI